MQTNKQQMKEDLWFLEDDVGGMLHREDEESLEEVM